MNPFEFEDYRQYFREEVAARKKLDSSINFQQMANSMRVQKPFLSKVINGHLHLTSDQLYLACSYLCVSPSERQFIELNHCLQTSSLEVRKRVIKKQIEQMKTDLKSTDRHIESTRIAKFPEAHTKEYYLDPLFQLLHIAMTIKRYRTNFKLLASDLMIPLPRILFGIERLEHMGVLKREGAEVKVLADNLHLPRNSNEYIAWNTQLRLSSLQRSHNLPIDEAYGFSVVFSTEEMVREQIQKKFLKFINDIQKMVKGTSEDNIYQLNFDLMNWNHPLKKG